MITFGIVGNFYISINPVYPDPCQRTYRSGWTQGNLGSPFSIDPQAIIHNEGIIGTISIKFFGKKYHFLNDALQSYYDLFQVNWLVQN